MISGDESGFVYELERALCEEDYRIWSREELIEMIGERNGAYIRNLR